jgi:1A family penicillin-binding protein
MKKIRRLRNKRVSLPPTIQKKLQPVSRWFAARWRWFQRLSTFKKVALIAGPILAILIIIPLGTYIYFANTISNPDQLLNYNNTGVVLLDKDGEAFYSFGTAERGERLSLDQISDFTEKAVIASEDGNFYEHGGFSLVSILGALFANVSSGDFTAYGGSTLTQQLAKNTVLYDDQTIIRKYQELAIAIAIEQQYSKDEILDLYLNSVYYGEGAFGIEAAAKTYFNTSAADLDLAESAMLIGLLPAPSAYSPLSGSIQFAKERQATVLGRMVNNGVITQAEADAAATQELLYAEPESISGSAPHFAEMVLHQLYREYGEETVNRSGYKVTTTLDRSLQSAANEAVDSRIGFIQTNGGSNASVVAIEPSTGSVLALVGSADYANTEFGKVNMATTPRQPGSSVKPLYFAEAMQQRLISPATIYADELTDFGGYQPLNADRNFRGDISVRNALAQSLNIPAVKVMQELGVENSLAALKRLGITTLSNETDYGLSLALGTGESRLTEMTNAYAAFGNKGTQYDIRMITSIEDKFGDAVVRERANTGRQVMGEEASFLISDILNDESARAPVFGSSLNTGGYDVAVKTGTTENARDAWTIGYSTQLVVGVWVGNNDNTPMRNGGSSMAGPIWQRVLLAGMSGTQNQPFTVPGGIERLLICRSNGLRAVGGGTDGTYQEFFIRGAVPTGTCDVAPEPTDADEDGVLDEDDQCADTPADSRVDDTGCVEENVPADSDGDGILDADDRCEGTPINSIVDESGCRSDDLEDVNEVPADPLEPAV